MTALLGVRGPDPPDSGVGPRGRNRWFCPALPAGPPTGRAIRRAAVGVLDAPETSYLLIPEMTPTFQRPNGRGEAPGSTVLAFGAMPRFLCDAMLGSLARWLRLLGFDTEFDAGTSDRELAVRAGKEGRWLLTRDHELAAAGPRSQLVRSDSLEDQLVEVLSRHGLSIDSMAEPARCSMCNGELEPVAAEAVAGSIPPHVASSHEDFYRCGRCGRVYWRGSHVDRIEARLGRVRDRLDEGELTHGR